MMVCDIDFNEEDDWFSGDWNCNIGKGVGMLWNNLWGGRGGKCFWDLEMWGKEWDRDRYDCEWVFWEFFDWDCEFFCFCG